MLTPLLGCLLLVAPLQGPKTCVSLDEARGLAAGKAPIVVWTKHVAGLRDRPDVVVLEALCLRSEPARALLDGLPLVFLDPSKEPAKGWDLPAAGFSVLDPAGKEVRGKAQLSNEPLQTIKVLAKLLERPVPDGFPSGVKKALEEWAGLAPRVLASARAGDDAGVQALLLRSKELLAHPLPTRLLERQARRAAKATAWLEALPEPRPVRDLLVVVEDRAGFAHALRGWAAGPIHPILFLDAVWLPRFLAAFKPAKVVFVPASGEACGRAELEAAVAKARGEGDGAGKPAPGLVLSSEGSAQCEAALALAAGHRQRLTLDFEGADHGKVLDAAGMDALRARLRGVVEGLGVQAFDLCDDLDLVTLAVDLPYRWLAGGEVDPGPLSVDDDLCRDDDELRWAFTGRLVGDRDEALYMAMCALFLRPGEGFLFSRYNTEKEPWSRYSTAKARAVLGEKFPCTEVGPPDATLETWRERFGFERNLAGLVHVNSSGGPRAWSTIEGQGDSDDVPETVPAIVSYVHSFSAADPWDPDTIAGRWLRNGAYAYFGAMHEPYLDAFVPIDRVWSRSLDDGMPLAMAQASFAGEGRWRPWKLCFLGDPLLVLDLRERERVAADDGAPDGALSPQEALRKLPSRLRGADRKLRTCELRLLAPDPAVQARDLRALLDQAARSAKALDDDGRRRLAALCALHLEESLDPAELARDLERMAAAGLVDAGLGYRLSYLGKLRRSQVEGLDEYRELLMAQPWSGWQRKLLEKRWPEGKKKG
ncbi:MAG: hypothetical protein R3F30_07040 [Planctomycetota bacterium]